MFACGDANFALCQQIYLYCKEGNICIAGTQISTLCGRKMFAMLGHNCMHCGDTNVCIVVTQMFALWWHNFLCCVDRNLCIVCLYCGDTNFWVCVDTWFVTIFISVMYPCVSRMNRRLLTDAIWFIDGHVFFYVHHCKICHLGIYRDEFLICVKEKKYFNSVKGFNLNFPFIRSNSTKL